MDVFNVPRTVEQGIYDVMMWVFFYPYTLLRMVLRPAKMLAYVEEQSKAEEERAFASAMRPALLLFLSIAIGSLLAPLPAEAIAYVKQFTLGKVIGDTWFGLLIWRMMVYSFFALVGALLFDLLTPGEITRDTLRLPFNQQCYICAPFSLLMVPLLVNDFFKPHPIYNWLFTAGVAWFLLAQFLFYRRFLAARITLCMVLAATVFLVGYGWIFVSGYLITWL